MEYTASLAEAEGDTGALGGEDALLEYTASEAAAGVAGVEAAAAARLAAFISRTLISMYSWRDTVSVSSDVPGSTYTGCVKASLPDTGKDTGAVACGGDDDRDGTLLRCDGSKTMLRADTEGEVVTGADDVFEEVEEDLYIEVDVELLPIIDPKGRTGTVTGLLVGTEEDV